MEGQNFIPLIVKTVINDSGVIFSAVVKEEELFDGIGAFTKTLPNSNTRKIIIGPISNAADALLYNEAYEKKYNNTKVLRANDYEENRKKAFAAKKKK